MISRGEQSRAVEQGWVVEGDEKKRKEKEEKKRGMRQTEIIINTKEIEWRDKRREDLSTV